MLCPLALSCVFWRCPMSCACLSYVPHPCPMSHGRVLCPVALSCAPWPCPMSHGPVLCPRQSKFVPPEHQVKRELANMTHPHFVRASEAPNQSIGVIAGVLLGLEREVPVMGNGPKPRWAHAVMGHGPKLSPRAQAPSQPPTHIQPTPQPTAWPLRLGKRPTSCTHIHPEWLWRSPEALHTGPH